jgi:hypothetical protein
MARAQFEMQLRPQARRTIFVGFRTSAKEQWGEAGLADIGERLPHAVREATVTPVAIHAEMLPEEHVLAWYQAAWEGPAQRDKAAYNRFLQGMMNHGFGKVRRALLQFAGAQHITRKASELWRHDHNTGELCFVTGDEHSAVVTLADHAYLSTPLARSSLVEILRYAAALGYNRDVSASYVLESPDLLRVQLSWK